MSRLKGAICWLAGVRGGLSIVAGLLAIALWTPLWSTRMESPQYHGSEALKVLVYAGRVTGDVHEIETLNQYIGVHMRLDLPELHAAPWVVGFMLMLALISLGTKNGKKLVLPLLAVMVIALAGGVGLLQYRLYVLGHDRGHSTFARFADFTPPVIGSAKIANFTIHTQPECGGWALFLALPLTGWIAYHGRTGARVKPMSRVEEPARTVTLT